MYNTRKSSELDDSLDYLIPPVKKLPRAIYNDFLYKDVTLTNQERLVRNCHKTVFADRFRPKTIDPDVQTCSSLILKKTAKQLIHQQYSILNISSCNHGPDLYIQNKSKQKKEEKRLIKVTIVPTTKETQTSSRLNNRYRYSKIVQSTVSNQENFIKNQNVYLLTNCNKRKKIHELKTSESAKLSDRNICNKYGDISFKQITESRQIINSLNMDKRKRKDNKNKKAVRTHISDDREPPENRYGNQFSNTNVPKSRVRVVGQIGINQNDRYVLKCAAAVNDKPNNDEIPTRFNKNYNFHHSSSQYRPTGCTINNCEEFRPYKEASQGTQVNFNFPNPQSIKKFRNQTAQCDCNRAMTAIPVDPETDDMLLKKCNSPLVIISVYPRKVKETDENDAVKIVERRTSPERKELTNKENFKQLRSGKLYTTNKMEAKLPRSRSPSPKTKIGSKKNVDNKTDSRGRNNNSVKKSGLSPTASNKYYIVNSLEDNISCHCLNSKFLKTEDFKRQENKEKIINSKDTQEVKKALVNSFLRNVNIMDNDNRKSKLFQPKNDTSKVTINIDGDKDRYDVLLEHSYYDTDIAIKRPIKPRPSRNFNSEEMNTKSLENFLMVSNEKRKNEYTQEGERTQTPGVLKIKPSGSRLNIKDSIEIRRQGEHSNYFPDEFKNQYLKPHLKTDKNNFADTVFNSDPYAPVRHYRGDDCSLSDPNERDREIRELLGILGNNRQKNTDCKEGRPTSKVSCCCKKWPTDNNGSKYYINQYLQHKSADTKCETSQMGPSEPKQKYPEISDPNQYQGLELEMSRKKNVTQKTKHEHFSEDPDLEVSEQEIYEETTEDSSKEPIHCENHNATNDKTISEKDKYFCKTVFKKGHIMPCNLVLNRNVQVILQIEQFTKERPVVLNKTQYEKIKKIIESSIAKKLNIEKRKRCSLKNYNMVSIGAIRVKPKSQLPLCFNREIQTDWSEIKKTAGCITDTHKVNNTKADDTKHTINKKIDKQIATDVIVTERDNIEQVHPREALSSVEIRYAHLEYKKRVIMSSSCAGFKNDIMHSLQTSNDERNSDSIHTIFKGYKKSATPNLGTSVCSLYSNISDFSSKSYKQPRCTDYFKPKKPFLQRLISCLVMRSTQTSNMKDAAQKRNLPSIKNSLDSYHISTSLGALDMTSSLYDTSASFYSNHTTMPVNKIKRGFLSSVRVFLTSRRS